MKRLALLLIICITGAQASMFASQIEATEVTQLGEGNFFWLQHYEANPALEISFTAERVIFETRTMTLREVDLKQNAGPVPIPIVQVPGALDAEVTDGSFANVTGELSVAQVNAMMTLFSESLAQVELEMATSIIYGLENAKFDADNGISQVENQGTAETFSIREFAEPLVISETESGAISLTMTGDLVLEVEFMDFELYTDSGKKLLQSTHERTLLAPETPGAPAVSEVKERFVRMVLRGAEIHISDPYFAGVFQGATTETQLQSPNPIYLKNATGELSGFLARSEDVTIQADALNMGPSNGGLTLEAPAKKEGKWLGTMATSANVHFAWLLSPLVLLPFLRRRPTLERMEGAIEAGKFQQASLVAKKLLRRTPYEERATMGYAVAQAKLGDHNAVVSHLQSWLKSKTPTDGVFHYVLGISFMELGKDQVAREQFAAAIKLTPSLQGEIPSGPVVAEHAYA